MLNRTKKEIRPAIVMLLLFTLLTGVAYPLVITAIAQVCFPHQANGSLLKREGKIIGSELIAQEFTGKGYFWSRPSAAGYNAASSSGSNLAPSNPDLVKAVKSRVSDIQTSDTLNRSPIPTNMVLTSASGLDPHISVEAALFQAPRVARERGMSEESVKLLVRRHTESRTLGVLGEEHVNVLLLNLSLDDEAQEHDH